jgi:predicted RNA binding protein YcfA (HicA-like mRNA interferase family)
MSGKDLIKLHLKEGWKIDRIHGSHYVIEKDNITVPIPVHGGKDLPNGTVKAILKVTGVKI